MVDGRAVERRQRAEAQAVQVHGLEVVVVEDEILVALVGALLRGLAAATGIEFLDHEPAGRGMRQPQVHDAPLRDHHLVRRAVEEVFPGSVAAGDAVDARRNFGLRKAAAVGLGQVRRSGGDFLDADDRTLMDRMGITVRIDGVHRQQLQGVRPGTLVFLDTGHGEQGQSYEQQPFHSLIRQVSP